ncbi:major tail protein [Microbacterium phage Kauala]|nr:major tail protein [Microbacterium phage Kauala]
MAPITQWNPSTQISRGNVAVGVAPAVEDINNPVLAELSTGIGLDCSITTMNGTSSTDSESIDWLCDPASEQLPGSTTHSMDDLLIKATGQEDEDLINGLNIGDVVYIWRRDGLAHDTALAADQKVWVWKAIITSIDPAEANNTFVAITAHITVLARSVTAVAIAAA